MYVRSIVPIEMIRKSGLRNKLQLIIWNTLHKKEPINFFLNETNTVEFRKNRITRIRRNMGFARRMFWGFAWKDFNLLLLDSPVMIYRLQQITTKKNTHNFLSQYICE